MRSSALKQDRQKHDKPVKAALAAPMGDRPARCGYAAETCDGVIDIAAALFNVSGKELRHPGRSVLNVSRVRQIAMYVTHVSLGLSMREVGHGFGRDRTTVLYACHQIEDMRDDAEFDAIVCMVERVVTAAFGAADQD